MDAAFQSKNPLGEYLSLAGSVPCVFGHRLFAFVIDSIVVAVPCFAAAEIFRSYLIGSPEISAVVGLVIILCYFGIFGSRIVDGQTLGMMAFSLRVAGRNGDPLSISRSFIRYLILFVPLAGENLLPLATPHFLANIYEYALSGAGFAIFYLAIFNQRTGQSLHDLATDAFVVDSPGSGEVRVEPFWKPHWTIVAAILVLGCIFSIAVPKYSASFQEVTTIEDAVSRVPVGKFDVRLTFYKQYSEIIVEADCNRLSADHNSAAAIIAAEVLRGDAQAVSHDYLEVNCVNELRLGFFRSTSKEMIVHTPQEWKGLIR